MVLGEKVAGEEEEFENTEEKSFDFAPNLFTISVASSMASLAKDFILNAVSARDV